MLRTIRDAHKEILMALKWSQWVKKMVRNERDFVAGCGFEILRFQRARF